MERVSTDSIVSKAKQPEDTVPMKMMTLLLELLKSNELSSLLAIGGRGLAWARRALVSY
jgi:hypothetical protein